MGLDMATSCCRNLVGPGVGRGILRRAADRRDRRCFFRLPRRAIAMAVSVGAGCFAGASLKVAADAIRIAGPMAAAMSLLLGAAVFSASNALVARFGAGVTGSGVASVSSSPDESRAGSGIAIALGNALDTIPEAMLLGIALGERVFPTRAGVRVLGKQPSRSAIERRGDAKAPQFQRHLLTLDRDRHRGSGSRSRQGMSGSVLSVKRRPLGCSVRSRSPARDDGGNDDPGSLPQQSALLRAARRLRFRPPAPGGRHGTVQEGARSWASVLSLDGYGGEGHGVSP